MGDLSKPMVSMIIPVFNAEKYVQNAIECVINQTYSNWELILVDNCSEDSTVDICKSWKKKDSRIKVISQSRKYTNSILVCFLFLSIGPLSVLSILHTYR